MINSIKSPLVYIFFLLILNLFVFYVYYFATKFTKELVFKKTFYTSQLDNKKMITLVTDIDNNVYKIQNAVPLLHFTASELNAKMDFAKTYRVKGYGLRIPFLGIYPNIINISEKL